MYAYKKKMGRHTDLSPVLPKHICDCGYHHNLIL
jgi:hypothetical protein